MSERPVIEPARLAAITGAVPSRLLRKLDRQPELAESWRWRREGEATVVETDKGARVTLRGARIADADQIACDCLLAPRCIHVLAVATRLPLAESDGDADEHEDAPTEEASGVEERPATEDERAAAATTRAALVQLAMLGATGAGVVVQAQLLRGLHLARVASLPRLATAAQRTHARLRRWREEGRTQAQLEALLASWRDALLLAWALEGGAIEGALRGQARRRFEPLPPTRLVGLCCAPFVSETGYAGVTTWLVDRGGALRSVSSVRSSSQSGGARRADLAPFARATITHAELSRAEVALEGATASADGRLGAGAGVRVARLGDATLDHEWAAPLFAEPWRTQLRRALGADPATSPPLFLDVVVCRGHAALGSGEGAIAIPLRPPLGGHAAADLAALVAHGEGRRLRMVARLTGDAIAPLSVASPGGRWDLGLQGGRYARIEDLLADAPIESSDIPLPPARTIELAPWWPLTRVVARTFRGGWRSVGTGDEGARLRARALPQAAGLVAALESAARPSGRDGAGALRPPEPAPFASALTACAAYLEAIEEAARARAFGLVSSD